MSEHLDQAHDAEPFGRIPEFHAGASMRAADAGEAGVRKALPQSGDQVRAEQVARRFAGDENERSDGRGVTAPAAAARVR